MVKTVCVYCSSSDAVSREFVDLAETIGRELAANSIDLIYGGAAIGLMGAVARSAKESGSHVTGVIPEYLNSNGISYEGADELIVTETMAQRKDIMSSRADGFITLPGGFGTLEEIMEMITLRQLGYHDKPLIIVNYNGFYDQLFSFFERIIDDKFMKREFNSIYRVADSAEEAVRMIQEPDPFVLPKKWF